MTVEAVNVTCVPAHTSPGGLALMLMLTGRFGFTAMAMGADVAGLPVGQVTLDVIVQVMTSPFAGA